MDQIFERIMPGAARVCSIGRKDELWREAPHPSTSSRIAALTDAQLSSGVEWVAALTHDVQAIGALLAAEVARRSRPELGYAGLAQSSGHRTAEAMIQSITKAPYREAARLVKVGEMLAEAEAALDASVTTQAEPSGASGNDGGGRPEEESGAGSSTDHIPDIPWSEPVGNAVRQGTLSVASADSIVRGLGQSTEGLGNEALYDAATLLVGEAAELGADQLFRRARQVRDALDRNGVADRERKRYEQRFLKIGPEIDGLRRITGLLDPESAAIVCSAIDAVTSPRRGGPRFVDPAEKTRAEKVLADPRSTEQLALDALVDMVRIAGEADPNTVFGKHRPAVRMIVTADELRSDRGCGWIEGAPDAVSLPTIRRGICNSGLVPVLMDATGQALDVGHEQRLFTRRQRIALAVRDGGCLIPGCDRPPSWTEAHHINPYSTGGKTDVRDGVLLCRHHHMLVHNNGWQIVRDGADYSLKPPRAQDPAQKPIRLASKNPVMHDLAERRQGAKGERRQGTEAERWQGAQAEPCHSREEAS